MIVLTEDQAIRAETGEHGYYVKLSPSLGIKVIHSPLYSSKAKAYSSRAHRHARQEAETLQYLYETGVVPRCYGATLVKFRSKFQMGVLMQHLGSITLANSEFYDSSEIFEELKEILGDMGIKHNDLHEDNVMIYRNKFYAIDFSPTTVSNEGEGKNSK